MSADSLILASLSPFRAELLKNAGVNFAIEGAQIDERKVEATFDERSPETIAINLSQAKACDVSKRFPSALIIGCDQTLDFNGQLLHKAATMEDARQRLLTLSGKIHYLHSAISLFKNGTHLWSDVSTATMTMRILAPDYIGRYLSRVGQDVLSSVGAYQIEGEGIQLFDKIEGDSFTIIGLPLLQLLKKLRAMGVIDG
ncbi:Maf family nucleotide pyrophosphatase [Bartonella tamiae]|uniref:7-methyl-GTP pyrophosphatase n=1 Tax=Bartonella tamiae Th239 TaxID=1094558 RepID=J1K0P4_9HYPH|nr:Maf family nucleotide pyrophosphatase [Bartonella tamiae]EJF90982.1 septum formation protein Maf [Bartonella tamiae Th239]EJF93353.1 septum formation protein Maf [Bartonella tamiae Th307]